jgi:hypothetical protein
MVAQSQCGRGIKQVFLSAVNLKIVALWVCLSGVMGPWAHAGSVRQVAMDEMIQHSRLVFEGEVMDLVSVETGPRRIHTHVTFRILDIIKGDYPLNTITLRFLGGTVGNVTMGVSDMILPRPGEHGIYFVESLERMQVHPLFGWRQGHFLVQPDRTGTHRVLTAAKAPVTAVVQNRSAQQSDPGPEGVITLSTGVARGVVAGRDGMAETALTTAEFKKSLRKIMEESNGQAP